MNFLIGFVILLFAVQAPTDNGFITTTVASISEGSSVLEGGLQEGDTIISIDGFRLLVRSDLNVAMGMSSSTTHSIKVRRGGGRRSNCRLCRSRRESTTARAES